MSFRTLRVSEGDPESMFWILKINIQGMLDQETIKDLYTDKYQAKIGLEYNEWLAQSPDTEDQAYARLQEIDDILKDTYEDWRDGSGLEKEELETYRDSLKAEYDLIEEMFGLELND